jgi:hypothetical protein
MLTPVHSPIQPTWLPPNCHFEVDDAEKEWTFPPNHFDFIHVRNVAQGIQNWDKLMEQVYRFVQLPLRTLEVCS